MIQQSITLPAEKNKVLHCEHQCDKKHVISNKRLLGIIYCEGTKLGTLPGKLT
jgi:hypothetical protein